MKAHIIVCSFVCGLNRLLITSIPMCVVALWQPKNECCYKACGWAATSIWGIWLMTERISQAVFTTANGVNLSRFSPVLRLWSRYLKRSSNMGELSAQHGSTFLNTVRTFPILMIRHFVFLFPPVISGINLCGCSNEGMSMLPVVLHSPTC